MNKWFYNAWLLFNAVSHWYYMIDKTSSMFTNKLFGTDGLVEAYYRGNCS